MNLLSGEEGIVPKSLAIIPFPSKNLKGLIKSLEIRDKTRRGGVIDSSITVIFDEVNDLIFYRNIHDVEHLFNAAATRIIQLVEGNADKLKIEIALKEFYDQITSSFLTSIQKKEKSRGSERSLILLFNLAKKDLDKIVHEIILGNPVIVTGDKPLVELVLNTLAIFSGGTPEIVYWTEEHTSGDIIGGPPYLVEVFKSYTILDLKNGKVINGKSNKFSKKLLKRARQLDSDHAEQLIKKNITKFFAATNLCLKIVTNKVAEEEIDRFISDLDIDEIDLIETYTKFKHPDLADQISETATHCRKKMSKIMSGFEKQKW